MKQRLFWNWRAVSLGLIASLGAAAGASSDPGYLRWGGPALLRFAAPLRPPMARFVLPAAVPAPEPPSVASQIEQAARADAAPKPAPVIMQADGITPQQRSMDSGSSESVIAPQMFLRFFNQSTNGTSTAGGPSGGVSPNGASPNGSASNSGPPNGASLNGAAPNGAPMNFTQPRQSFPQGSSQGSSPQGWSPGASVPPGIAPGQFTSPRPTGPPPSFGAGHSSNP